MSWGFIRLEGGEPGSVKLELISSNDINMLLSDCVDTLPGVLFFPRPLGGGVSSTLDVLRWLRVLFMLLNVDVNLIMSRGEKGDYDPCRERLLIQLHMAEKGS